MSRSLDLIVSLQLVLVRLTSTHLTQVAGAVNYVVEVISWVMGQICTLPNAGWLRDVPCQSQNRPALAISEGCLILNVGAEV